MQGEPPGSLSGLLSDAVLALLQMQRGGMACAEHLSPLVLSRSLRHCRTTHTAAVTFLCGLARPAEGLCCSPLDAEPGLCHGCPLLRSPSRPPVPRGDSTPPLCAQGRRSCSLRAAQKKIYCGFAAITDSPGGTDLSSICKAATGLSSCRLVWLCSEEQHDTKEPSAPCGGFSRSPRSARGG